MGSVMLRGCMITLDQNPGCARSPRLLTEALFLFKEHSRSCLQSCLCNDHMQFCRQALPRCSHAGSLVPAWYNMWEFDSISVCNVSTASLTNVSPSVGCLSWKLSGSHKCHHDSAEMSYKICIKSRANVLCELLQKQCSPSKHMFKRNRISATLLHIITIHRYQEGGE
jgi:hypothetical protein